MTLSSPHAFRAPAALERLRAELERRAQANGRLDRQMAYLQSLGLTRASERNAAWAVWQGRAYPSPRLIACLRAQWGQAAIEQIFVSDPS